MNKCIPCKIYGPNPTYSVVMLNAWQPWSINYSLNLLNFVKSSLNRSHGITNFIHINNKAIFCKKLFLKQSLYFYTILTDKGYGTSSRPKGFMLLTSSTSWYLSFYFDWPVTLSQVIAEKIACTMKSGSIQTSFLFLFFFFLHKFDIFFNVIML